MEVKNMIKIPNPQGQTVAFFSVETAGYVFNQMRLMKADNGKLYAHLPAREYMNRGKKVREQWYQFKDLDMIEAVTQSAREIYEQLK